MELKIQRLNKEAVLPTFAYSADAGMDLYSVANIAIEPGERAQIPTGIAIAVPEGYVGLVWDKSGVSHRLGIKTLGGVIDAGYRGEIFVGLLNTSKETQNFEVGNKIAQMLLQKIEHPTIVEVESLAETQRGDGAFGSTGK